MIYVLIYGSILVGPAVAFGLGWWARGWWDNDKAGRAQGVYPPHRADELARETRHLFTDAEWVEIENLANGGSK